MHAFCSFDSKIDSLHARVLKISPANVENVCTCFIDSPLKTKESGLIIENLNPLPVVYHCLFSREYPSAAASVA